MSLSQPYSGVLWDDTLTLATDTNSTMSGISGAGRVVGSLVASAGSRMEKVIDRFAERQLGLGPNAAAIRFIAELHQIHIQMSQYVFNASCTSEHEEGLKNDRDIALRLIWVCNGTCSQCQRPYVLLVLQSGSHTLKKALSQLASSIRVPESAPSNVELSAQYLRIIAQSQILVESVFVKMNVMNQLERSIAYLERTTWADQNLTQVLAMMQDTKASIYGLLSSARSPNTSPTSPTSAPRWLNTSIDLLTRPRSRSEKDNFKSSLNMIQLVKGHAGSMVRRFADLVSPARPSAEVLMFIRGLADTAQDTGNWAATVVAIIQLCTILSIMAKNRESPHLVYVFTAALLARLDSFCSHPDLPDFLTRHITLAREAVARYLAQPTKLVESDADSLDDDEYITPRQSPTSITSMNRPWELEPENVVTI